MGYIGRPFLRMKGRDKEKEKEEEEGGAVSKKLFYVSNSLIHG